MGVIHVVTPLLQEEEQCLQVDPYRHTTRCPLNKDDKDKHTIPGLDALEIQTTSLGTATMPLL